MHNSFVWKIGFRYAGLQSGNRLLWFLSRIAITGMVLAVALLIVVLSVMNGFDRELRVRILSIVPHLTIYADQMERSSWEETEKRILNHPEITRITPFVEREALLKSAAASEPLMMYGMDQYPPLMDYIQEEHWAQWLEQERGILISALSAKKLGLQLGDEVLAIFPPRNDPRDDQGTSMQLEVFTVSGIFNTNTELDKSFAWVHLAALQEISGMEHPQGFRLALRDLFQSREVAWQLLSQLPDGVFAREWSQTHGNLYEAVQMSRSMVSLLMIIIIAVAVFNVVSTLMLVVMEKKQAIAILQVMGATRKQVVMVFVIQGMLLGLIGTLLGALLGSIVSLCLPSIVSFLEQWFHFQLLTTEIYPVSYIPSDLRWGQVVWVVSVAVMCSLLASFYPAWQGARTQAANVLRYE